MFLTVHSQAIDKTHLIADYFMVRQMVQQLLVDGAVLVFGPGLFPSQMI